MVDAQFAPLTDKLLAAIRSISDKPVRFLINTHVHGDHTGVNENFAKAGALIFSRDQLRDRLARPNPAPDGTPGIPAPAQALPVVTYDGPVTIHVNGEDVQLLPIRAAHTDGDTLIYFPRLDVLAVGDYIRTGQTIQFHIRDQEAADAELKQMLAHLRNQSRGAAGALVFTCNGRGTRMFSQPHHDAEAVERALGAIPVAGFFAQGEIGPVGRQNFMHGFTASVAVFEPKE